MRFPSIYQLWDSILSVSKRFAPSILFSVIAVICAITVSYESQNTIFLENVSKGIYLGNFGLALSIALQLYAESKSLSKRNKILLYLPIFLLLGSLYFLLNPFKYQSHVIVLIVLGIGFHLLVSFVAFYTKSDNNGFWQLNRFFFLRFVTSGLYSAVLFVGLSIAILSIALLFDIKWDGAIYFRLWVLIAGLFNTIFFLSGIPKDIGTLNEERSYPKGLKIFTQYVLIPLAVIYLCILLAYELKIVIQWELPDSSVAILILGYAVFGILSILLIHPIKNEADNKWLRLFSKSFYLLLIPLLILLAIAIIKRVSDYGVTESRYLLIVLALWLSFITAYFLIKGQEQIRIIPISLFICSILITVGPWGMQSIARKSQLTRMQHFLLQKPTKSRNEELRLLINHISNYYGIKPFQTFVSINLTALEENLSNKLRSKNRTQWEIERQLQDTIITLLKIPTTVEVAQAERASYANFKVDQDVYDLDGASKILPVNGGEFNKDYSKKILIDDESYLLIAKNTKSIRISNAKGNITFSPDSLMRQLLKSQDNRLKSKDGLLLVPAKEMSISKTFGNHRFVLQFQNLNGNFDNLYYTGFLLVYRD